MRFIGHLKVCPGDGDWLWHILGCTDTTHNKLTNKIIWKHNYVWIQVKEAYGAYFIPKILL
jgi:hypothetical protein